MGKFAASRPAPWAGPWASPPWTSSLPALPPAAGKGVGVAVGVRKPMTNTALMGATYDIDGGQRLPANRGGTR